MSEERLGGTLLVASAIVLIFAGLIRPGGILVDHADQTHFTHVIEAMVSNPVLTHVSAFLGAIGLLLMLGGLLLARRVGAVGNELPDSALRVGFLFILTGTLFGLLDRGLIHATAHVKTHGLGIAREQVIDLVAVTLQATRFGGRLVGAVAAGLGFFLLTVVVLKKGIRGFPRLATIIMAVYTVIAFIALVLIDHVHSLTGSLGPIFRINATLRALWLLILGLEMYKGLFAQPDD